MEKRKKVIEILTKVLTGEMSPEVALESWPSEEKSDDRLMNNAWHALYHYCTDDDIRAKEPAYGARQRSALAEFIVALRQIDS